MIRRWLALTYYLYALRLAALSHFYFNRLYLGGGIGQPETRIGINARPGKPAFQAARPLFLIMIWIFSLIYGYRPLHPF